MERNASAVIAQERLMHETPSRVYDWLGRHNDKEFGILDTPDDQDEELEMALLSRKDPLIRVGLAQWCFSRRVMSTLLEQSIDEIPFGHKLSQLLAVLPGGPSPASRCADAKVSPLRVALLRNQHGRLLDTHIGNCKNTRLDPIFRDIIEHGPYEEVEAMLSNGMLSPSDLADLFQREGLFADLPDERFQTLLCACARNPRLNKPRDETTSDGLRDYLHNLPIDAAYELTLKIPTTQLWARVVENYLNFVGPPGLFPRGRTLEEVLARWRVETVDDKTKEERSGFLTAWEEVRLLLAIRTGWRIDKAFLTSDDRALRCAAYKCLDLESSEIARGFERDGRVFLWHALGNQQLYRTNDTRHALSKAAREASDNSQSTNTFCAVEMRLRETHPEYFGSGRDREQDAERKQRDGQDVRITAIVNAATEPISKQVAALLERTSQMNRRLMMLFAGVAVFLLYHIFGT